MAVYHARSNSFPSREHPLIPEFDEHLSRLRSSQDACSSKSIVCKISGLQDLHDYLDRLLLLPHNQQALSNEQNKKRVDVLLDGSLRILDVCSSAKDALLQTKESTRELQSILRRKRDGLASEVKKFLASRKIMKKAIQKAMGNSFDGLNKDDEIVGMLREVESITLAVFESLFSFLSGSKSQNSSRWSLISKLINSKRVVCEEINELNECESASAALQLVISDKTKKSDSSLKENAQNELQKLEMCVEDLEEGVESLYRRIIKTRVSLLNILNN